MKIIGISIRKVGINETYFVGETLYYSDPEKNQNCEYIPEEIQIAKIIKRAKNIGSDMEIDCYCICDETGNTLLEINEGTNLVIHYEKQNG